MRRRAFNIAALTVVLIGALSEAGRVLLRERKSH